MEQIIFETWVHMDWIQPTRFWKRENKIVLSWEKCEFELGSNKKEIRRKKRKKKWKKTKKREPECKEKLKREYELFLSRNGCVVSHPIAYGWAIQ